MSSYFLFIVSYDSNSRVYGFYLTFLILYLFPVLLMSRLLVFSDDHINPNLLFLPLQRQLSQSSSVLPTISVLKFYSCFFKFYFFRPQNISNKGYTVKFFGIKVIVNSFSFFVLCKLYLQAWILYCFNYRIFIVCANNF